MTRRRHAFASSSSVKVSFVRILIIICNGTAQNSAHGKPRGAMVISSTKRVVLFHPHWTSLQLLVIAITVMISIVIMPIDIGLFHRRTYPRDGIEREFSRLCLDPPSINTITRITIHRTITVDNHPIATPTTTMTIDDQPIEMATITIAIDDHCIGIVMIPTDPTTIVLGTTGAT